MNQKTCKKLRRAALTMGGGKTTMIMKVNEKTGRAVMINAYKELKRRHVALPWNERGEKHAKDYRKAAAPAR